MERLFFVFLSDHAPKHMLWEFIKTFTAGPHSDAERTHLGIPQTTAQVLVCSQFEEGRCGMLRLVVQAEESQLQIGLHLHPMHVLGVQELMADRPLGFAPEPQQPQQGG